MPAALAYVKLTLGEHDRMDREVAESFIGKKHVLKDPAGEIVATGEIRNVLWKSSNDIWVVIAFDSPPNLLDRGLSPSDISVDIQLKEN